MLILVFFWLTPGQNVVALSSLRAFECKSGSRSCAVALEAVECGAPASCSSGYHVDDFRT